MSTMDQKDLRRREALCTQEQPPGCAAGCPLHVDARALCQAVAEGNFTLGRSLLEKAVVFPRIIARLCQAPCTQACRRGDVGEAIGIRALEEACMRYGQEKSAGRMFRPKKTQSVLVLGGDLSGLSAAVELARKGYQVTLMEESDQLGGVIRQFSPQQIGAAEIAADFQVIANLGITVQLHVPLISAQWADLTAGYDAIFVSHEAGCHVLPANITIEAQTLQTNLQPALFVGLPVAETAVVDAIGLGKRGAISIDRYVQHVSLTNSRENEGAFVTTLITSIADVMPLPAIPYVSTIGYNKQEAAQEAARCLDCQCLECVKGCAYMQHYKGYPKKYIREIYNTLAIVMGNHVSNTMINTCSLCGQCKAICPYGFDLGDVCKLARRTMVKTGKMPPSTHEFALLDMAFSNSEAYFMARHQPNYQQSTYAFFPGCQMGASSPEIVQAAYGDLTARLPGGVGLILGCCGAIADWAGREAQFAEELAKIEAAWESLGRPKIITACPTCFQVFSQHTAMNVTTMTEILEQIGLPEGIAPAHGTLAIHDACAARQDTAMQDRVRRLVGQLGYDIAELPYSKETTSCCGYGGLTDYANREVGKQMIEHCIGQSDQDYLTYCVNCRDRFVSKGKTAWHLLELIYGARVKISPGLSARRYNRLTLKAALLKEFWGEDTMAETDDMKITIDESLVDLLEERLILYSDLQAVLAEAEASGRIIADHETGYLMANHRSGNVTFWVVYSKTEAGYQVHNAYSYRMEVEEV